MLRWFSISGISKEAKRVRWPGSKELFSSTGEVLLFIILFMAFFTACEFIITFFLKTVLGIGA